MDRQRHETAKRQMTLAPRHRRMPWLVLLLTAAFPFDAMTAQQPRSPQRPMTVDDLFTIQGLTDVAVSPDGTMIAAVVQRPATEKNIYGHLLDGNERADIWLLPRRGGKPRNLTNGNRDHSGFWQPRWSPDGRRLAMLSTRGGDNVRPYLCDVKTGAVTRLIERGVDLGNGLDGDRTMDGPDGAGGAITWLDATTLLVLELPEGEAHWSFDLQSRWTRVATREWAKMHRGEEPTASELESGPDAPVPTRATRDLRAIDVARGTSRVVATVPYYRSTALAISGTRLISVSPDRRHVALLVGVGPILPDPAHRVWGKSVTQLGIVSLQGNSEIRWVDDRGGLYVRLCGWSPDGSQLAVLHQAHRWTDETADELFAVTATSGEARPLLRVGWTASSAMPPGWQPKPAWYTSPQIGSVAWTSDGRPVVHAESGQGAGWWHLEPSGPPVNVVAGLKNVPRALEWTGDPNSYLGVSDGDLWRLDVSAGAAVNLTTAFTPAVTGIVTPELRPIDGRSLTEIVVTTEDSGHAGYARIPVASGQQPAVLPAPSTTAKLDIFRADLNLALFTDVASTGTFLWRGDARSTEFTRLLTLNDHLAGIADVQRRLIRYRGIDGDTLRALLLLPPNYDSARRYPLVAWVYPTVMVHDTVVDRGRAQKNSMDSYNLIPLVSRGYAVLLPSMPLQSGPGNPYGDPYIDLAKGLMPAVDKAVELGIADPDRLGVMGISFGGYSTFALVTYTTRFKAAVAMAGISDLSSLYGEFSSRFSDGAHERLIQAGLAELGSISMGAAPWENLWRYLRNSPLFFVDRVQTPLMIIHGDQDEGVTMSQSEEFFTALYRQGKRAKFIRYWGEGHGLETPPNVRHMWGEIFAWFDTYLAPRQGSGRAPNAR